MSATRTKIFGMDLGVDPKIIAVLLVIVAIVIYYFTSASDSPGGANSTTSVSAVTPSAARPVNPALARRTASAHRAKAVRNDHSVLKFIAVDGSRGDVDPTLRLRLLERVRSVPPAAGLRNLFDSSAQMATNLLPIPKNVPKINPGPVLPTNPRPVPPPVPAFSIPLKYYGFVKPNGHTLDGNRGFFMDGDNILVGSEGDVLEKHFLVVALTPNSARLEDTTAKQGQDIQVIPAANPTQ
jgi:hypothetical protein